MKITSLLAALAATALVPTLAHAGLDTGNPVHPLVGVAITAGGDKLSEVDYVHGGSRDITAGGLVQVWGGVEWHEAGSPFGVQATIGYHFDNASADNGSQRFDRIPLELIGLYSLAPKFRLGVGLRYAAAARFHSDGAGYVGNYSFKSEVAPMVVGEWLITPSVGVQLRYVHETYKLDGYSIDGSHGGVGVNYYF
jgi:hypothetical protein